MTTKNLNARITALEAHTPSPIARRYFAQYGVDFSTWSDEVFDAYYAEMQAAYPVEMAEINGMSDAALERLIERRS